MSFSLDFQPRLHRALPATLLAAALTGACVTVPQVVAAPEAVAQTNPIFRAVLQPGANETEIIVSWRTNATGAAEVLELTGPDGTQTFPAQEKNAGALAYKSNFATATGLKENSEYSYRVGSEAGGWSAPETFKTGTFGTDWSFITVTDAQIGVGLGIDEQTKQWQDTLGNAVADDPNASMVWSLGDQVDGWGGIASVVKQYDGYFAAPEIRQIPVNALPGNHETYDSGMKHYDEHFISPNQEHDIRDFYFERNNVLFIGLDSNASSAADIQRHAEHLRRTIANRGAFNDWIIVGMHHAFFSQGDHYTDGDVTALREGLAPVLSELGVDLVLSGHDHIYTRTHLMNGTEPVLPADGAAPARGDVLTPGAGEVLYITTTTAGGGKYYDFQGEDGQKYPNARMETVDPALPHKSTAIWRQDYNEDYLSVDVTGDTLKLTTYNANDPNVVDQVTLKNRDRALPDPRVTPLPTVTETVTSTVTSGTTTVATATETTTVTAPAEPAATTIRETATETATATVTETAMTTVPTTVRETQVTEVPATQTVTETSNGATAVHTTVIPSTVTTVVDKPTIVTVPMITTAATTAKMTETATVTATEKVTEKVTETAPATAVTVTETAYTTVPTTVAAQPGATVTVTETETAAKTTLVACAEPSSGGAGSSEEGCQSTSTSNIIAWVVAAFGVIFGALGFFAASQGGNDGDRLPRWIPAPVRDVLGRFF